MQEQFEQLSNTVQAFFIILLIAAIIFAIVFITIRVKKKRKTSHSSNRRRQIVALPIKSWNTTTPKRSPFPVSEGLRSPTPGNYIEYLSYRKCPACHSENSLNAQCIYKIGDHQFVCHRCGHRFNF